MRKIIATEFYTIDGLMSDPTDQMSWVLSTFNQEMGEYETRLYENADACLLGRKTYKIFEGYWPNAATDPDTDPRDAELAPAINNFTKIVFSKTIKKVTWTNSILKPDLNPVEISNLKKQKGKDILVVGSASIVQQLLDLGLIDELHLLIHPVILGTGKELFQHVKDKHKLTLLDAKTLKNGVMLLRYQFQRTGGK